MRSPALRYSALAAAIALTTLAACGGSDDATSDTTSDATATTAEPSVGSTGAPIDVDAIVNADLDNCAAAPTGEPIKVGMAMDFGEVTGYVDNPGSELDKFVAELANCAGGIDGHPIEVQVEEVGDDAALATQKLLDWGAQSIVGPPFADFALPIVQTAQGKVPMFASASTEPTLGDAAANSYLVTFDDNQMGAAAAEWAFAQGITRAILFTEGAGIPYSGVNPDAFAARFAELGGEVVSEQTYVWAEDTDFSSQVNEIKGLSENNEVVFGAMLANQMVALKGQLEGQGLDGLTYIGTDALDATGIQAADGNEGVAYTAHTAPQPGDQISTLLEKYAAAKGSELESPGFMGLYVDSMLLGIQGALNCGCSDPAEIGAAVAQISGFEGVSGTITYAGTSGIPTKSVLIKQIVNGEDSLVDTIGG